MQSLDPCRRLRSDQDDYFFTGSDELEVHANLLGSDLNFLHSHLRMQISR